ncbi:MAG TPA: hypothetical protein VLH12_08500 [Usitatibacter sp.]|nr:hypothetical protein [Usitatibacter sp.]
MTVEEARRRMTAVAAELAALVRAHHLSYVGAENKIAAHAEALAPAGAAGDPYREAWKLYDHGIEQFRAFHASERATTNKSENV